MSHSAHITSLAEKLADSVTGLPQNSPILRRARTVARNGIANQSFLRSNHFDINDVLTGLIEKLYVRHRPDLAEGLQSRLDELRSLRNRWTPDFLSLLLSLSSNPVVNGKVKISVKLDDTVPDPEWDSLMADMPGDSGLWNQNYAADSSEDELMSIDSSPPSASEPKEIEDVPNVAALYVYQPDIKPFHTFLNTFSDASKLQTERVHYLIAPPVLPELQVCREMILMARGFTTPLFQLDGISPFGFHLSHSIHLHQTSLTAPTSLLREAAQICSLVHCARLWAQKNHPAPFLSALSEQVFLLLRSFDVEIGQIESALGAVRSTIIPSILHIIESVRSATEALISLANVIISSERSDTVFDYLDNLFEEVNQAQVTGKDELFSILAKSFLACLQVYLRPTVRWISSGKLDNQDSTFFVKKSASAQSDLSMLWYSTYEIRKSDMSRPLAPRFIHTSLLPVLTGGKTMVFLRELGVKTLPELDIDGLGDELTIESIVPPRMTLLFTEQVKSVLSQWFCKITEIGQRALFRELRTNLHLSTYSRILNSIFLAHDSVGFFSLSTQLYDYMITNNGLDFDALSLTQIAQLALELVPDIEPQNIQVTLAESGLNFNYFMGLENITVTYNLPWYIKNVVTPSSMKILQRVHNLLLCIERVRLLLSKNVYVIRDRPGYHQRCDKCTRSLRLRQRSMWFVTCLNLYLMADVIHPLTDKMNSNMDECSDLDQLFNLYREFTLRLQSQCFLTDSFGPVLERILKLLMIGIEGSEMIEWHFREDEPSYLSDRASFLQLETQFDEELSGLRDEVSSIGRAAGEHSWNSFLSRLSST